MNDDLDFDDEISNIGLPEFAPSPEVMASVGLTQQGEWPKPFTDPPPEQEHDIGGEGLTVTEFDRRDVRCYQENYDAESDELTYQDR